jgi:hypothetical protein
MNADAKLTKDEMIGLGDKWFNKLDPEKSGKLSQQQFMDNLVEVFPPPPDRPPEAGQRIVVFQGGRSETQSRRIAACPDVR